MNAEDIKTGAFYLMLDGNVHQVMSIYRKMMIVYSYIYDAEGNIVNQKTTKTSATVFAKNIVHRVQPKVQTMEIWR